MADLRRRIEQIIEADPVIRKGIQRGIVNSRALARYVQNTEGVDSTHDAILGIIRRYEPSATELLDTHRFLKECEVSLRSKIAELVVKYHQETMYQISEFVSNHKTTRGERVKLVVEVGFIRIIADQRSLEDLSRTLRPGEIIGYSKDLTEITLHLPDATSATKKILAKVTMELALNDIDLAGIVECAPGLTLVVAETDAPRTLEALQTMLREGPTNSKQTTAVSEMVHSTQHPIGEYPDPDNATVEIATPTRETSTQQAPRDPNSKGHKRF
jgi:hypothetical protein